MSSPQYKIHLGRTADNCFSLENALDVGMDFSLTKSMSNEDWWSLLSLQY